MADEHLSRPIRSAHLPVGRLHQGEVTMLRLVALLLFGYCTYRIGREFVESVPDDFELVGETRVLLPSPERQKHDAHIARKERIALRKRRG